MTTAGVVSRYHDKGRCCWNGTGRCRARMRAITDSGVNLLGSGGVDGDDNGSDDIGHGGFGGRQPARAAYPDPV